MPNEGLAIPYPFTGGLVDLATRPDQMERGTDVIFPRGIACERGGYTRTGPADPIGTGQPLRSVVEWLPPVTGVTTPEILVTDSNGAIARMVVSPPSTSLLITGDPGVSYFPGPVWQGEQLFMPQDGRAPILRYSGAFSGTLTAPVGSVSINPGESIVNGTGTNFTFAFPQGTTLERGYLQFSGVAARVARVNSDTQLTLATPWEGDEIGTSSWTAARVAPMSLKMLVNDLGRATSGLSVTGFGTLWQGGSIGQAGVIPGDTFIFRDPEADDESTVKYATTVTAVNSETSMTLSNSLAGFTKAKFVVIRKASGKVAAIYRDRLWIAGAAWADDRLYYSPPGYSMDSSVNGIDSPVVDYAHAKQFKWIEVPAPEARGKITSLRSTPAGLMVFRDDSTYLLTGSDPFRVDKIADVGCSGPRGSVVADEVTAFAGREGVFLVRGERIVNITDGTRDRTWREFDPVGVTILGIHRNHLFVHVVNTNGSRRRTMVYDLSRDRWCGDMSLPAVQFFHTARNAGQPDEMYAVGPSWEGVQKLSTTIVDHDSDMPVTENPGTFSAQTRLDFFGSRSQVRRPLEARVTFEMRTEADATLKLSSLSADGSAETERVFTATGAGFQTKRVRAGASSIGRRLRYWGVRVTRSGGVAHRLAVYELQAVARRMRERA